MMLLPSIASIALLRYLERYNVRYQKISVMELPKNKGRDWMCGIGSGLILLGVIHICGYFCSSVCTGLAVSDWIFDGSYTGGLFRSGADRGV